MDSLFYGLMTAKSEKVKNDFALKNAIPHPFQTGASGDKWLVGFIRRHPGVTLRSPAPTSLARSRGFNRPYVTHFYTILSKLI
jgi:hypothetical protein